MTGRNYMNPGDRGRFGFSESGEFKAPYKGAHIFAALFIAAGIFIDVVIFGALVKFGKELDLNGGELFTALVQAVVMIFTVIATIFVEMVAVRAVTSGYRCSFTANDEKFILTYGGDVYTFYYNDVQAVHFIQRTQFGKVSGYDVTIKVNGAEENFSIVSDAYISEKSTPFQIIRERAEMARNARYIEQATFENKNSVGESSAPIFASDIAKAQENKKDVIDRVADMLGKDAEMPGVSLAKDDRNTARAVRAYRAEQEARAKNAPVIPEGIEGGYDISKVMEKVSPTVRGYAADMPALGKDGKVIVQPETFVSDDGRQTSLDDIQGSGTFRVAISKKLAVFLWIVVAALLAWVVFLVVMVVQTLLAAPIGFIATLIFSAAAGLPALVIAPILVKYIRQGKEVSYKANGREFVVASKKQPEEHIYYNEVAGVTYSKLKFLWFDNGYKVEITTNFGVIKYDYIYPRFHHAIKTEDLPFELIRKNAERLRKG